MTSPDPDLAPADRELLAALGDAVRSADPVPDELVAFAKAAFTWRTVDEELAALVEDTALEAASGVRATESPRMLTFDAPGLTVVVEVTHDGPRRRLLGQLVRPRRATIDVRHVGGQTTVEADDLGRFRVDSLPAGLVSLVCRFELAGSRPVVTTWVTV